MSWGYDTYLKEQERRAARAAKLKEKKQTTAAERAALRERLAREREATASLPDDA